MKRETIILHKIIMFIPLFCSADTLLFGSTDDSRWILTRYILEIGIVLWMLGSLFYKNKIDIRSREICLVSMLFLVLMSSICNHDFRFGYVYIIMLLIMGWAISRYISLDEFVCYFCNFMKFFAVISIIFFGIYVCCKQVMDILPLVKNSGGLEHYTIFLSSMPVKFYKNQYRNASFFREPGVFQMYIIWALMFEVFWKKKINIPNCIIFLIALLTTFSTTAYIAAGMLIICYFLKKGNYKDFILKGFIFFAGGLLLIGVIRFTNILAPDGIIFGKFTSANNPSFSARFASLIVNFIMIGRKPILGNGLTFTDENFSSYALEYLDLKVSDNTIMILYMLATFGIIFTTVFAAGIWLFCKRIASSRLVHLGIVSIFLVLFIGENLIFSPITYIFVFYGLGEVGKMVKYNENIDCK